MAHVAEVKGKAEDTVLIGCQRIGKEIEMVPKAAGRPAKIITGTGKNKSGRGALNIPGTSRARLQKLASPAARTTSGHATAASPSGK